MNFNLFLFFFNICILIDAAIFICNTKQCLSPRLKRSESEEKPADSEWINGLFKKLLNTSDFIPISLRNKTLKFEILQESLTTTTHERLKKREASTKPFYEFKTKNWEEREYEYPILMPERKSKIRNDERNKNSTFSVNVDVNSGTERIRAPSSQGGQNSRVYIRVDVPCNSQSDHKLPADSAEQIGEVVREWLEERYRNREIISARHN